MRRFLASFYRITSRAGFLSIALVLGLIFWYLPNLLNLDVLRPRVTDILETTFHGKVLVGSITAQLFPSPGLVIAPVVLMEDAPAPRVLVSVRAVRMSLSAPPLLRGDLEFKAIRFFRPRFIVHRVRGSSGPPRWVLMSLPNASAKENKGIDEWLVREGRLEIWDETRTPTAKWVADHLSGYFDLRKQTGELSGTTIVYGRPTSAKIQYSGAAPFPVQARLEDIEIGAFQFLVPKRFLALAGHADLSIQTQFQPALLVLAQLDQPSGVGHLEAKVASDARENYRWSVRGNIPRLKDTAFDIPEWSAKEDDKGVAVAVHGTTTKGGITDVLWTKASGNQDATLIVNARAVTVRQVLEIFKVQSTTPAASGASFNPRGYESWLISQGSLKALIHGTTSFEFVESHMDVAGMNLILSGTFDLLKANPQGHLHGEIRNIPVASVVESFFPAPSTLTGSGAAAFNFTFPLSGDWLKGLKGPVQVEVKDGVLKNFKTLYRIMTVLNLGNYLRFRLPKITAQGVVFENLSGHLLFQNGVMSTKDLFLKSPDMNIGVSGSLDIPGKQIKATLRLEMLRFLEDILKVVPITHWIFKKPNKILLPLAVFLDGPWDDIRIY